MDPGTRDILQDNVSHIQPIVSAQRLSLLFSDSWACSFCRRGSRSAAARCGLWEKKKKEGGGGLETSPHALGGTVASAVSITSAELTPL